MYFKLEHLLNQLTGFDVKEPVHFDFADDQQTSVTIRPLTTEEKEKYKEAGLLFCTAVIEEEPPANIRALFERLAIRLMPEGFKKPKARSKVEEYKYVDDEGKIEGNHTPPASLFPQQFQVLESQLLHSLSESIRRTVRIIRWRYAIKSAHRTTKSTRGMSWSFDNQLWRDMPHGKFTFFGDIHLHVRLSAEALDDLQNLMRAAVNEPLAHDLFLEAWQHLDTNPRSALIIGMAAAEVGVKQCIGRLVPHAEWLANNVPSPPLHTMLSQFLPLLPSKLKVQGRVLRPPKRIITMLKQGAEARNKTAHIGSEPP